MEPAGETIKALVKKTHRGVRRGNKIKAIAEIRQKRAERDWEFCYTTIPFVLCCFPLSQQPGVTQYVRRNGKHTLRVVAEKEWGLPWGIDRLIPLWIITEVKRSGNRVIRFQSMKEILDMFGLANNGRNHKRIQDAFRRIFSSTIIWDADEQVSDGENDHQVWQGYRFNFIDQLQLKSGGEDAEEQASFPDMGFDNIVVVSEQLYGQILKSPIPIELRVIRYLTDNPGATDLFIWLSFRCKIAKNTTRIPLFGDAGLREQLGLSENAPQFKVRQMLKDWLAKIRAVWPECPAVLQGDYLVLSAGAFILPAATRND